MDVGELLNMPLISPVMTEVEERNVKMARESKRKRNVGSATLQLNRWM